MIAKRGRFDSKFRVVRQLPSVDNVVRVPVGLPTESVTRMLRRSLLLAAFALACLAPTAAAADHVPGEVVVRYASEARVASAAGEAVTPRTRVVKTRPGQTVADKAAALLRRPGVLSATPNYIARASYIPNDPGRADAPGGWQAVQWNFVGPFGVNAPSAWDHVAEVGRPGGVGVTVAVLDTGVAYSDRGPFTRSPDLRGDRFHRGYDFVDEDRYPNDQNGHGTHVASTIAESIDNGVGVTGLAFGAKIMPVRVLDRRGEGDSVAISRGIRFAARKGASIINLSFEFGTGVRAREIPDILDALDFARRRGVLVIGAAGNGSRETVRKPVAYPARATDVLSVGATTEHGCLAEYSNSGPLLDLVAPGGGKDAVLDADPNCKSLEHKGRDIVQMTFQQNTGRFGLPGRYTGTSMAAPHVSGIAALVIASGVLGPSPTPDAIEAHLKATARDLGIPGPDDIYGSGLVDAAAATARPT
jgi:serine protease